MGNYGAYTIEKELHRTALGRVFSARREGQAGAIYAIKTCEPDPAILSAQEARIAVSRFLGAAAAQREAAEALGPAGGFAPIHQCGPVEGAANAEAAYYVTDLALRGSCERLAAGAARVDAAALANIVRQVVAALVRLRRGGEGEGWGGGRIHGNLLASNVLLMDDGPLASARVMLCDPVSGECLAGGAAGGAGGAGNGAGSDLRALGELIYRLVVRRRFAGGWPIADSAHWHALGRSGGAWRELCNRLLDPSLEGSSAQDPAALTIEQVAGMIPSSGSARRRRTSLIAGVGSALLLAGLLSLYLLSGQGASRYAIKDLRFDQLGLDQESDQQRELWERLVNFHWPNPRGVSPGWVDQVARAVRGGGAGAAAWPAEVIAKARELQLGDPDWHPTSIAATDLATTSFAELRRWNADEWRRAMDARSEMARFQKMSDQAMSKTREAIERIESLRTFLLEQWGPAREIGEAAAAFEKAGWTDAAEHVLRPVAALRQAVRDQTADGQAPPDAAPDLGPLLAKVGSAGSSARELTSRLASIDEAAGAMAATGDAVLVKFRTAAGALVGQRLRGAAVGAEGGAASRLRQALDEVGSLADDLRGAAAGDARLRLDTGVLESELAAERLAEAEPTEAAFRKYLDIARGAVKLADDPLAAIRPEQERVAQRVSAYARDAMRDESAGAQLQAEASAIASELEELGRLPRVNRHESRLRAGAGELSRRVRTLGERADTAIAAARELERRGREELMQQMRAAGTLPGLQGGTAMSAAVDAEWARRREAVFARAEETSLPELRRRIDDLVSGLGELARSLPRPLTAGDSDGAWARALAAASIEARESAITMAIKAAEQRELDAGTIGEIVREVESDFGAFARKGEELQRDLQEIDRALRAGEGLTGGVEQRWERWQQDPFVANAAIAEAIRGVGTRVARHKAVRAEADAARLVAIIDQAGPEESDVAVAAWERLSRETGSGGLGWPRTGEDLARAGGVLKRVVELAERGMAGRAELSGVKSRVAERARGAWNAFAERQITGPQTSRAARAAALAAALDAAEAFGIGENDISSPRVRLARVVRQLASAIRNQRDAAKVKVASRRFGADVAAAGLASEAGVPSLLTRLAADVESAPDAPPITELGPGQPQLGGAFIGEAVGDGVEFTAKRGNWKMRFMPVRVGEEDVFIATEEMSIEAFASVMSGGGEGTGWDHVAQEVWLSPSMGDDWFGPCGWVWPSATRAQAIRPAPAWWDGAVEAYRRRPVHAGGTGVALGPGSGEPPSGATPMHRISALGAEAACRAMGCELPTVEQWRAAFGAVSPAPSAKYNLRDAAFKRQDDHINQLMGGQSDNTRRFLPPDEESYAPDPRGRALSESDRCLWFWPVNSGPDDPFRNILGNVGEWVRGPGDRDFAVVGGSALSGLGSAPDQPVKADGSSTFWDVGFRPAFTATGAQRTPLWQIADGLLKAQFGEERLPIE